MKIFLTVGTQLPFPRLIKHFEQLALSNSSLIINAQISDDTQSYSGLNTYRYLSDLDYLSFFSGADLVVSHAGMGTVIQSLETCMPLIVVPRDHNLGEHRNSHQTDTARWFEADKICPVVWDLNSLTLEYLHEVMSSHTKTKHSSGSLDDLIDSIHLEISR